MTSLQVFLLSFLVRAFSTEVETCSNVEKIESRYDSDFVIIGMYPIRVSILSRFNHGAFMRMEATRFAINQGNDMLWREGVPLRVGYIFYDCCNRISTTTNNALDFILRIHPDYTQLGQPGCTRACLVDFSKKVLGVIGTASSGPAMHLSSYLEAEELPIISYGATSVSLSAKKQYPLFRRTIPPDNFQAKLITDLILKFNWTYVTLIHADDTYGRTGRDALYQLFKTHHICTSAVHSFPYPLDPAHKSDIMTSLKAKHLSRVVVLWLDLAGAESMLTTASQYNIRGKTWILTEAVARATRILDVDPAVVHGLLTITPFGGDYPEFDDYFWRLSWRDYPKNPWLAAFFKSIEGKAYNATGHVLESYKREVNTEKSAFSRNAVFAYIHALKSYYKDTFGNISVHSTPKISFFNRTLFNNKYLRHVTFEGLDGQDFEFDSNGDPSNAIYHIYAVQAQRNGSLEYSKVADWSTKQRLQWHAEMVWSGNTTEPTVSSCAAICGAGFYSIMDGQTSCCWVCIACPANMFKLHRGNHECAMCPENTFSNANRTACVEFRYINVHATGTTGILIIFESTVTMTIILAHILTLFVHRNTPVARSTNLHFSFVQLSSQLLMSAMLFTFFVPVTTTSCIFRLATLATFLTVSLTIILAKTEQILRIFHTQGLVSRKARMVSKSMQAIIVVFLTIAQWCLLAATLLTRPVSLLTYLDTDRAEKTDVCNMDIQLFAVIVYDIILCVACAVQAFRARNLPANFNEARSIAYVTFVSCILLAIIIPLYRSINDNGSKLLVLATFLSLTNLVLVLMYSQRVYVILFRPELNDVRAFKIGSVAYCMAEIDGQIRTRSQRIAISRESTSLNEHQS